MDKKDLCANRVCIGSLVALKVRLYSSVVFSHDNINQPNLPKILLISNLFTSAKLWAEAWGMMGYEEGGWWRDLSCGGQRRAPTIYETLLDSS